MHPPTMRCHCCAGNFSEEEQQAMERLRALTHQINHHLPQQLEPQYEKLVGNALLNLAIVHLAAIHGHEATANLLAGAAEFLWARHQQQSTAPMLNS